MARSISLAWTLVGIAGCLAATNALAGATSPDVPPIAVRMSDDGPIYVTASGMTLYENPQEDAKSEKFSWSCLNTRDTIKTDQQTDIGERPLIGGTMQKTCIQKYPPYLAAAGAAPSAGFSIVTRPDGSKQWARNGFPLYTFVRDKAPGDRTGATGGGPFGGFRLAAAQASLPAGVTMVRREQGMALAATAGGKIFYTPRGGRVHKVALGADPMEPLRAPALAIAKDRWSIVEAGVGRKQFAFDRKPLFVAPDSMSEAEMLATGVWEPVYYSKASPRPAQIGTRFTLMGDVYTTAEGKSLYTYGCRPAGLFGAMVGSCDDAGDPANYMVAMCGDAKECSRRWRPNLAPNSARPGGDWSVVEITDPPFTDPHGPLYPDDAPKVRVWAYRGRPTYTYYEDETPGDIWGAGSKGLWGSSFGLIAVAGRHAFRD